MLSGAMAFACESHRAVETSLSCTDRVVAAGNSGGNFLNVHGSNALPVVRQHFYKWVPFDSVAIRERIALRRSA